MAENAFLTYKGKPMVRKGNVIYYGNSEDKFIIMLTIKSTTKLGDAEVPDKVLVQLVETDKDPNSKDRIAKQSEKVGLYNAMDIAAIWLDRALKD